MPVSGIRTNDRSVREGEDGSCLRHRGHCGRPLVAYRTQIGTVTNDNRIKLFSLLKASILCDITSCGPIKSADVSEEHVASIF
jgi:hypothetical protein